MSFWPTRRVLITGGAGFVGANLARALVDGGAEVHVLVRPGSPAWRLDALRGRIAVHPVDLLDIGSLERVVARLEPEVVFHLARRLEGRSACERSQALAVNVQGTFHLLEATAPIAYHRLVHLASSLEYGPCDRAVAEAAPLRPATFYGATKAAATLLVEQHARAMRKPAVILRAFSVYGPWESEHRLIPTLIRAARSRRPVSLTEPGVRHDYLLVDDLVRAALLAAEAPRAAGQVLNVATGVEWCNHEVAALVAELCQCSIPVRADRRHGVRDVRHWVADVGRARDVLGFTPAFDLRCGLERTIAWYRTRPVPKEVGRGA